MGRCAPSHRLAPHFAANDSALLVVEFAYGAHGSIHISAVSQPSETIIGLNGEAGSLEFVFTFTGAQLCGWRQAPKRGRRWMYLMFFGTMSMDMLTA